MMEIIDAIIVTLNSIEVKGKDNLSKLLGCIEALEEFSKTESEEKDG